MDGWEKALTAFSMDSPSSATVSSSKTVSIICEHLKINVEEVCLHGSPYSRMPSSALRTNPIACF